MKFAYFDVHSHLNLSPLFERAGEIVEEMKRRDVGTITVGVDLATSKQSVEIAETYDNVWACVGMHPADNTEEVFNMEEYKRLARHGRVVAIGECGLDYFWAKEEAMIVRQKEIFKKQIELAMEVGKPLMIHARPSKGTQDAYEDVLEILEQYVTTTPAAKRATPPPKGGEEKPHAHFHFFVGDVAIAERALAIGCTFSFDGPITFSKDYDEVIKMLPLQAIMLETDTPFAAPVPHRGKTCEPWMVEEMYKKVAELKELPLEVLQKQVQENIQRVFGID
jgi:TatD DNase family protein